MAEFTLEEAYGTPAAKPVAKPKPQINPALVNALTPLAAMPVQAAPSVAPSRASPELVPSLPPAGLTPKARNEFIANEANRIAAEKIKRSQTDALPPTDFSAKSQKLKDFEGYLNDYKDELYKNKKVLPANIPLMPVDANTATITSKYTALLMGIKDAYQLGALTGPDMGLVQDQLTNPATISGMRTSRDAMKSQVEVLEGILKRSKENLESSYGKKMDLGVKPSSNLAGAPTGAPVGAPPEAKKAKDGKWYSPDPARPGKYLQWGGD